jgi:hypothetical protein
VWRLRRAGDICHDHIRNRHVIRVSRWWWRRWWRSTSRACEKPGAPILEEKRCGEGETVIVRAIWHAPVVSVSMSGSALLEMNEARQAEGVKTEGRRALAKGITHNLVI